MIKFVSLFVEMGIIINCLNNVMMEIYKLVMDAILNAKLKRIGYVILIYINSRYALLTYNQTFLLLSLHIILINIMISKFNLHNQLSILNMLIKTLASIFKLKFYNLKMTSIIFKSLN